MFLYDNVHDTKDLKDCADRIVWPWISNICQQKCLLKCSVQNRVSILASHLNILRFMHTKLFLETLLEWNLVCIFGSLERSLLFSRSECRTLMCREKNLYLPSPIYWILKLHTLSYFHSVNFDHKAIYINL